MSTHVQVIDESDIGQLTTLFGLLSDRTRLAILLQLADGERTVGHLSRILQLRQPTISHHVGLLRMGNVLSGRRDGQKVYYGIKVLVSICDNEIVIGLQNYSSKLGRHVATDQSIVSGLPSGN